MTTKKIRVQGLGKYSHRYLDEEGNVYRYLGYEDYRDLKIGDKALLFNRLNTHKYWGIQGEIYEVTIPADTYQIGNKKHVHPRTWFGKGRHLVYLVESKKTKK